MASCKIQIREGEKLEINIPFNIPNKIVDLWQEYKKADAILELNYQITKELESLHHKLKKKESD